MGTRASGSNYSNVLAMLAIDDECSYFSFYTAEEKETVPSCLREAFLEEGEAFASRFGLFLEGC